MLMILLGGNELKASQKGSPASNGFVRSNGCIAVEAQDWIDGINHPEWGHNQIHGPETAPFDSNIEFRFSNV